MPTWISSPRELSFGYMALATSFRFKLLGGKRLPTMLGSATRQTSSYTGVSHWWWPIHCFLRSLISHFFHPARFSFYLFFIHFLWFKSLSLNLKIVWGSIVMHHCLELTTELTISLQRRPANRNVSLARACSLTVDVTVGFLTCCQYFYLQPAIPRFTQFDTFIM